MARKKPPSPAQRRARELAWVLYITEGYIANLEHALAVNCITFNAKEKAAMRSRIAALEADASGQRAYLNSLKGD